MVIEKNWVESIWTSKPKSVLKNTVHRGKKSFIVSSLG